TSRAWSSAGRLRTPHQRLPQARDVHALKVECGSNRALLVPSSEVAVAQHFPASAAMSDQSQINRQERISGMTEEKVEKKSLWHFTMEKGKVKTVYPHEPPTKEGERDKRFLHIPLRDEDLVDKIRRGICSQFGDHATGEGDFYDYEDEGHLLFTPE